MTQQRFTIRPKMSGWSITFAVMAAVCGGMYVATSQIEWALAAMLPAALAAVCWRGGQSCDVDVHDWGLEISEPPMSIHWEKIDAVRVGNSTYPPTARIPEKPILLLIENHWIKLAGKVEPDRNVLYRTILESIPLGGSRNVPTVLSGFLQEQLGLFGEERVWSFVGTKRPKLFAGRLALFSLAMLIIGIVWLFHQIQVHRDPTPLGVLGGMMMAVGMIMLLVSLAVDQSRGARVVKKPEACGLVISPKAFAMKQGPLSGTLRWEEIRNITFGTTSRQGSGTVMLHLDGALLTIYDIYDRPLPQIHELVIRYWGHEE